ncbi:MAG: FmdB family zinc ribbon protein [Candidatus Eisenbacteria bacterium]
MPTYVYECPKGHTFELFHAISDDTLKECPTCGAGAKRVPSGGGGVLFKGSGFYQTDYRSSSWTAGAKKEKGDSPAPPAPPSTGPPGGGAGGTPPAKPSGD